MELEKDAAKTFTQEEVNKLVAERLSREREKHERTLSERLSEAEKLAQMNAEQKSEYERQKREQEFALREREIALRELRAEARETLRESGLPVELSECLDYRDAEACAASLEKISGAFAKAVAEGVNGRIRHDTPSRGVKNSSMSDEQKLAEARRRNDTLAAIRIKQKAAAAGKILL